MCFAVLRLRLPNLNMIYNPIQTSKAHVSSFFFAISFFRRFFAYRYDIIFFQVFAWSLCVISSSTSKVPSEFFTFTLDCMYFSFFLSLHFSSLHLFAVASVVLCNILLVCEYPHHKPSYFFCIWQVEHLGFVVKVLCSTLSYVNLFSANITTGTSTTCRILFHREWFLLS